MPAAVGESGTSISAMSSSSRTGLFVVVFTPSSSAGIRVTALGSAACFANHHLVVSPVKSISCVWSRLLISIKNSMYSFITGSNFLQPIIFVDGEYCFSAARDEVVRSSPIITFAVPRCASYSDLKSWKQIKELGIRNPP